MYEEERKGSFIKDLIIKLLYMVLFLFLFMWLYPAPKVDLSDVKVDIDKSSLQPLFAGIYNDNINNMKEVAKSYYTVDRLPKTVGEKQSMTLQEMLSKKMIAPFVDENGKSCNSKDSYVEVTKVSDDEYLLKVYLACDNRKEYITDTIGCTSVCVGCVTAPETIAEVAAKKINTSTNKTVVQTVTNKGTTSSTSSSNKTTVSNNSSTTKPATKPTTTENKTLYKYTKKVESWVLDSEWTTTKNTSSTRRIANTKKETVTNTEEYEHTYRTASWVTASDSSVDYSLALTNIPKDAENVTITADSKFNINSSSEAKKWQNDRNKCNIYMLGYSCPTSHDENGIYNGYLNGVRVDTDIPSFRYNLSRIKYDRYEREWVINIEARPTSYLRNDVYYLLPIKFTVEWEIEEEEYVTKYQYENLVTKEEVKTSYSKNDTSLINQGYTFVGVY